MYGRACATSLAPLFLLPAISQSNFPCCRHSHMPRPPHCWTTHAVVVVAANPWLEKPGGHTHKGAREPSFFSLLLQPVFRRVLRAVTLGVWYERHHHPAPPQYPRTASFSRTPPPLHTFPWLLLSTLSSLLHLSFVYWSSADKSSSVSPPDSFNLPKNPRFPPHWEVRCFNWRAMRPPPPQPRTLPSCAMT